MESLIALSPCGMREVLDAKLAVRPAHNSQSHSSHTCSSTAIVFDDEWPANTLNDMPRSILLVMELATNERVSMIARSLSTQ